MLLADFLAQLPVLAPEQLALLGLAQRQYDLVRLEGLLHVVVRAGLHGVDRHVHVAVGAHHDDRRVVALSLQRGQQIEASHLGHAHVGQDHIGPKAIHQAERFLATGRGLYLVPIAPEQGLKHDSQVLFVVDD